MSHTPRRGDGPLSPPVPQPIHQLPPSLRSAQGHYRANGKRRRVYERWAAPLELFRELPRCQSYLRPHVTLAELDRLAQTQSDTEAAFDMQRAKAQTLPKFPPGTPHDPRQPTPPVGRARGFETASERRVNTRPTLCRLQAHPSMRKCWPPCGQAANPSPERPHPCHPRRWSQEFRKARAYRRKRVAS